MKGSIDYISPELCRSLPGLFLERVSRSPEEIAYGFYDKNKKQWCTLTWSAMLKEVCRWREALGKEDLQAGDRVALMLANSPDWIAFEQASLSLGLLVVPLYSNDRPENIGYILKDTQTKVLICPGITYFEHLAPVLRRIESLQRIVTIDDCKDQTEESRLLCISDWLPEKPAHTVPYRPITSETATIVYTSGTTGMPKGVMLSHQNILGNSYAGLQCMDIYPTDSFLSFLPMSHMLERTVGYYLPMMSGASVTFSRSIPELAEDLLTVKPTILIAVPRIFERVYGGVQLKLKSGPEVARKLFHLAVETGWKSFLFQQKRGGWSPSLLAKPLLDKLVGKKVRDKLGGNLRIIITGGAPLSADISNFFIGLGLPIYQGYGLTETSPIISVNRIEDNRPEGVGPPIPGVSVKVGDNNELLAKGSCVMQGYWNNPEATEATIDSDGWLHTGDQVEIAEGHIRITGRLKEILVLSNGEKVSPADMEMAISLDPLFEHSLVIGEGRPYLTLLCVLNKPLWEELAEKLGVDPSENSLALPEVHQVLLNRVERQLSDFPGFAFIKEVTPSLTPWTIEDGLLTPTMKMKRKAIEDHMASSIARMYEE